MLNYLIYISSKIDKKNKSWDKVVKKLVSKDTFIPASAHYDLGFAYCKLKKWNDAIPSLIKATEAKPRKLSWQYRLAISLENTGRKAEAQKIIEKIYNKNQNSSVNLFKSGLLLLGYSRPVDAETFFRRALEINNNNYKFHLALAIALKNQGKGKSWQSIKALENALIINPTAVEIHYSLGLDYEYMKNYSLASLHYIKAIIFNKKNKNGLNLKNHINKTKSLLLKERKIKLFTKISNLQDEAVKLLSKDPVAAENKIRNAIELAPEKIELYIILAESLEKQGESRYWQEIDVLKKVVISLKDNSKQVFRLGVLREKMKNFSSAKYNYELALNQGYKDSEILYRLGYCLEMLGDTENANTTYSEAINNDTKMRSQRFGIGVFHNKFNRKELAIKSFIEQLKKSDDDAELYYKLGMAYDRTYQWEYAKEAYKKALNIDDSIIDINFRLGFIYERLGCNDNAAYYYENAAKRRHRHTPYWYYRLGYNLNICNKYKESCEAFIQYHKDLEIFIFQLKQNKLLPKKIIDAIGAADKKEYNEAVKLIKELLKFRNEHSETLYFLLGLYLYKTDDFKASSEAFIKIKVLQEPHGVSDKAYRENENIRKISDYNHFYRNTSINNNLIVYESFQGASMACNPYALFLSLIKDPDFIEFNHVWFVNDFNCVPEDLKNIKNVFFVLRDGESYFEALSSAKILINNSTFPSYFIKKENQIYLNTWHGTPLKYLGRDMKGRFLEHKNFTRNILQTDILVSPNNFTSKIYMEKHDVKNIYSGKLLEIGYPRVDLTLNLTQERKEHLLTKAGIELGNTVVLYAPTWRGTHGSIDFDTEKLQEDLTYLAQLNNTTIVFRGHTLIEDKLINISFDNVVVLPNTIDTNEFLGCIDILITDYSSIFFDFYPTRKPIIFYAYDLDEYTKDRGLYFDIQSLPGIVCNEIESLRNSLKKIIVEKHDLDKKNLIKKLGFNDYDDGNATTRVIDEIKKLTFHDLKEFNTSEIIKNTKNNKSYLFYTGPFMRNGITTSFINLANALINRGNVVTVVVDVNAISKDPVRLEQILKLNSEVNIIGRVGGMNFSLEERFIHAERNRDYFLINDEMNKIWNSTWKTEFKRIFGNARFDYIVNFEGYTNFWCSLFSAQEGIPKTIFQHNDMFEEYMQKYPYLKGVFHSYNHYDSVISVSEETRNLNRENISKRFDVSCEKLIYSENLLNLDTIFELSEKKVEEADEFIFNGKGPVFINIGRLSIEKDHIKLLRAFQKVLSEQPSVRLIILGEGALRFDLVKLSNELNISDSVFFLGHKTNPYSYLKRSDCFVLSSNHEGQPMTLLESLTLGKDVIATSIAGNNSVLKLINEIGVENSTEGLASAMIAYAKNGKNQAKFDYMNYQESSLNAFIANTEH